MRNDLNPIKWQKIKNGIEISQLKCGWYKFSAKVNNLYEEKVYLNEDNISSGGFTLEEAEKNFMNHINKVKESKN
jgi:hypothetical protein|tara:strand:+ start:319 stop:543 length:225 start_codon:yes stop_codon:yes gene_type:complete